MSTITTFDAEPEDSWDATDALGFQLQNLIRRTELLTGRRWRLSGDPPVILDAITDAVRKARRKRLYGRQLVRADQIDEDVVFVRSRL